MVRQKKSMLSLLLQFSYILQLTVLCRFWRSCRAILNALVDVGIHVLKLD